MPGWAAKLGDAQAGLDGVNAGSFGALGRWSEVHRRAAILVGTAADSRDIDNW